MSRTFLDEIILRTKKRVDHLKASGSDIRSAAGQARDSAVPHRFRAALERLDRINIIAEFKRASPSRGVINADTDIKKTALDYEAGGASAISVLTETEYFGGSLEDLRAVSQTVRIPVLRKDFIIDEYQIYEAASAGADAVLLIVAALSVTSLEDLLSLTIDLGMDAIVEVHTSDEMERAKRIGAGIIGVNNRDLRSLDVSIEVSRRLITDRPAAALMVAESGLSDRQEIHELREMGFNAFLIGEMLMRSGDVKSKLRELTSEEGVTT